METGRARIQPPGVQQRERAEARAQAGARRGGCEARQQHGERAGIARRGGIVVVAVRAVEQRDPARRQPPGGHGMRHEPRQLPDPLVLRAVVDDEQRERPARIRAGRRPQARVLGDGHGGPWVGCREPRRRGVAGELDHGLLAERARHAARVAGIAERLAVGLEAVLHPVDLAAAIGDLPHAVAPHERRPAARPLELLLQAHPRVAPVGEAEAHPVGVHLRPRAHERGG